MSLVLQSCLRCQVLVLLSLADILGRSRFLLAATEFASKFKGQTSGFSCACQSEGWFAFLQLRGQCMCVPLLVTMSLASLANHLLLFTEANARFYSHLTSLL